MIDHIKPEDLHVANTMAFGNTQTNKKKGKMSKEKIDFKQLQWIKAPWGKGYVLVSKKYVEQFKKEGRGVIE